MSCRYYLGIDVGSTTVKVVVLDWTRTLQAGRYARSHGRPRHTLLAELGAAEEELGLGIGDLEAHTVAVACTGSGGRAIADLIGAVHVNELVAQTRAIGSYHPEVRTIIELGGQDSKFLSVAWDQGLGKMVLVDMAMNNLCAAGTGAFLDQQAERLGISIEKEFAEIALRCSEPARIAGRCTVFAKSDMIHLQQKGAPLEDILAGLCAALVRNFKTVIGKGKAFRPPIVFQGGVAYNQAVVRAFERVLKLQPGELIVPQHHQLMAAIGSALVAADEHLTAQASLFQGLESLRARTKGSEYVHDTLAPLPNQGVAFAARPSPLHAIQGNGYRPGAPIPIYLGIDVGSITTKVVAVDVEGRVLARRYLLTRGRPLEMVRRGLGEVGEELGDRVQVEAVGTTGSGRHLTAEVVGGDVVRSEITAQARAALAVDPQVDTIFEIGGQDSKYIRLERGTVVNFAMNSACAAGTGSFLEEQAERLQIRVEEQFSRAAFCSRCPVSLGERCTVFMESDLVHHQQQGAQVDDLVSGLAYAIVENYLNRVVGSRPIGSRVSFQGGVAWNDSVVAAFQERIGRTITVPPHHDVSGAIGVALLARDERAHRNGSSAPAPTRFRGFDLADRDLASKSSVCRACANLCEITQVTIGTDKPLFYGARCDLYDNKQQSQGGPSTEISDLFAERETMLLAGYEQAAQRRPGRPRVGLPRSLAFHDLFPYWRAFFDELGMDIVLSAATSPATARLTRDHATAETCYPVKLVHGHVADLLARDLDILFLPTIINRENAAPGRSESCCCPYVRAAGHMVTSSMHRQLQGLQVVKSPLHLQWERFKQQDLAGLAADLGVPRSRARRADRAGLVAQQAFYAALQRRGLALLECLPGACLPVVVVGRPYNTADSGACQDLPFKLRKLGVVPIPLDFLPLERIDPSREVSNMFWRCGQDILAAAHYIRHEPRLHAIYVTSFGCGPDSFIISYFRRIMAGKPYLELELDDHTADAGVLTRCEAFVESLQSSRWALQ